ncbi:MAG: hypothetical protein JNL74_23385 [Fibrobacteres bacterium]|nr:hypothetical protein [Fibrobacterota bacterium]
MVCDESHQYPSVAPFQFVALESCTQTTLPGNIPLAIPNGEFTVRTSEVAALLFVLIKKTAPNNPEKKQTEAMIYLALDIDFLQNLNPVCAEKMANNQLMKIPAVGVETFIHGYDALLGLGKIRIAIQNSEIEPDRKKNILNDFFGM